MFHFNSFFETTGGGGKPPGVVFALPETERKDPRLRYGNRTSGQSRIDRCARRRSGKVKILVKRNIQRTGVKLKRVSTAWQRPTPNFSSPRVGITQSKRSNNSLTIDGKIQRCNYIITLYTGASHSIINSTIAQEKFDPLVGAWFRTTTSEECAIKGKAIRNISISDVSMKHEFLVVDIMDEVILVTDFMGKHGFVLDVKTQVLQYAKVTLPLTLGYDRQAEVLPDVVQRRQKIPPKQWYGKAVVSPVNNLIPVRVLNPTSVTTKVHKGDIIAQCQKAEYMINHQRAVAICQTIVEPNGNFYKENMHSAQITGEDLNAILEAIEKEERPILEEIARERPITKMN
uniref:Uncharacterized protein n=1 Tax=Glossina austeni TaxID=7395 RepID=A0A1A9UFE8_GLOAU